MAVRILDCAPMSPHFPRWHVGAACLLVETGQGLVLVDTGMGVHDHLSPSLMVRFFIADFGIRRDPEQSAVRQLARLGYLPEAVSDIVLTHLHFDHAGGLPDFPHARVHVHRREYEAMLHPRKLIEIAYDRFDIAHQPNWVFYDQPDADWLGFRAMRLPFTPEMYMVPLFGHTRGLCGVAVREGEGWLFHCADALPVNVEFDRLPAWITRLVLGPHIPRLKAFAAAHPEVRLLAGHMWREFFI